MPIKGGEKQQLARHGVVLSWSRGNFFSKVVSEAVLYLLPLVFSSLPIMPIVAGRTVKCFRPKWTQTYHTLQHKSTCHARHTENGILLLYLGAGPFQSSFSSLDGGQRRSRGKYFTPFLKYETLQDFCCSIFIYMSNVQTKSIPEFFTIQTFTA